MGKSALTHKETDEIILLYSNHVSMKELAKKYKCDITTICRLLQRNRIQKPLKPFIPPIPDLHDLIENLLEKGKKNWRYEIIYDE